MLYIYIYIFYPLNPSFLCSCVLPYTFANRNINKNWDSMITSSIASYGMIYRLWCIIITAPSPCKIYWLEITSDYFVCMLRWLNKMSYNVIITSSVTYRNATHWPRLVIHVDGCFNTIGDIPIQKLIGVNIQFVRSTTMSRNGILIRYVPARGLCHKDYDPINYLLR